MTNFKKKLDSGEETNQGDDIQTIANFESSNERWRHLPLKHDIYRYFFIEFVNNKTQIDVSVINVERLC